MEWKRIRFTGTPSKIGFALFVTLVCLHAADIISTYAALSIGGEEANPAALFLMSNFGHGGALIVKMAIVGTVSYIYSLNVNKKVFAVVYAMMIISSAMVVGSNILGYLSL